MLSMQKGGNWNLGRTTRSRGTSRSIFQTALKLSPQISSPRSLTLFVTFRCLVKVEPLRQEHKVFRQFLQRDLVTVNGNHVIKVRKPGIRYDEDVFRVLG